MSTTINPVQTPVEQAPAFKAKDKNAKKIADGFMKNAKKLTPDVAFMEQNAGMCYAASVKNPAVLKETVLRETALGNFDFVKGINEYLATTKAKNIYKK